MGRKWIENSEWKRGMEGQIINTATTTKWRKINKIESNPVNHKSRQIKCSLSKMKTVRMFACVCVCAAAELCLF